jgi:hypothetical protein
VFTGVMSKNWEWTHNNLCSQFLGVLHGLNTTSKKDNKEYTHIDIGFLHFKVTKAMFAAAQIGDLAYVKKMAGVIVTLNSWRTLVEHVLRRLLSLMSAQRAKQKRIGNLVANTSDFNEARARNEMDMAKTRDNMASLPSFVRMLHFGYSAIGIEPQDECARIESRVMDLSAFVGERADGYWAQTASVAAPPAPSS